MSAIVDQGVVNGKRLMGIASSAAQQMPVNEAAGAGFVQAIMAQAACNSLLNILIAKQLITAEEGARFLGEGYEHFAQQMFSSRVVQPAAMMPKHINGRP